MNKDILKITTIVCTLSLLPITSQANTTWKKENSQKQTFTTQKGGTASTTATLYYGEDEISPGNYKYDGEEKVDTSTTFTNSQGEEVATGSTNIKNNGSGETEISTTRGRSADIEYNDYEVSSGSITTKRGTTITKKSDDPTIYIDTAKGKEVNVTKHSDGSTTISTSKGSDTRVNSNGEAKNELSGTKGTATVTTYRTESSDGDYVKTSSISATSKKGGTASISSAKKVTSQGNSTNAIHTSSTPDQPITVDTQSGQETYAGSSGRTTIVTDSDGSRTAQSGNIEQVKTEIKQAIYSIEPVQQKVQQKYDDYYNINTDDN